MMDRRGEEEGAGYTQLSQEMLAVLCHVDKLLGKLCIAVVVLTKPPR